MSPGNAAAPGGATGGGTTETMSDGQDFASKVTTDDALDPYTDTADKLLMAALRSGVYVLAVRCRVCGAPLTAKRSRARGVGPQCGRGDAA